MTAHDWESLRPKFVSMALRRKAPNLARDMGVAPRSVYNWISGSHEPSRLSCREIQRQLDRDCAKLRGTGRPSNG